MRAHRIIFRFDYNLCFPIMDRAGKLMQIMQESHKQDFFDAFRDIREERRVVGVYRSDGDLEAHLLSIEPKAIWAAVESVEGWGLSQLSAVPVLRALLDLFDTVRSEFNIETINRGGLRVFTFYRPLDKFNKVAESFRKSISPDVISMSEGVVGEITDYGWVFDGDHDDGLSYKLRCGPYASGEAARYMKEFADQFTQEDRYTSIIDLDLFETNFQIPHGSAKRWAKPLLERSKELATGFEKVLVKLQSS